MDSNTKNERADIAGLLTTAAMACSIFLILLYMIANHGGGLNYSLFFNHLHKNTATAVAGVSTAGIARACLYVVASCLYFSSLYFTGRIFLSKTGFTFNDSLIRIVTCDGLGAGMFSLIYLALGLAGFINGTLFLIIMLIPLVAGGFAFLRNKRNRQKVELEKKRPDAFTLIVFVLLAAYAAVGLIYSLTPPVGADSLRYHMAVPDLYLKEHRIFYIPYMVNSNWPQGLEMHFMAALSVHDVIFARVIGHGFMILAALAVAAVAFRASDKNGAAACALVFFSIPLANNHFFNDNVEPALAMFQLLGLYYFLDWKEKRGKKNIVLSGLFCGFACAVKLSGAAFFLIICALVFLFVCFLQKGNRRFSHFALFIIAGAVPVLPWLVKSYCYTGNPVWPFMFSTFGGRNWSAEINREYMFYMGEYFGRQDLHGLIQSIIGLFRQPLHENAGVVPLAIIPFLIVPGTKNGRSGTGLLAAAAFVLLYISWYFSSPQPRLLIPAVAILCPVFAIPLSRNRTAQALLIATSVFQLAIFFSGSLHNIPRAAGSMSDTEYLAQFGDIPQIADYTSKNLPGDSALLLMWDSRGYYYDRPYIWGDPIGQGFIDWTLGEETTIARLDSAGITHVVVNSSRIDDAIAFSDKYISSSGGGNLEISATARALEFQKIMIQSDRWKLIYVSPRKEYFLYLITELDTPAPRL